MKSSKIQGWDNKPLKHPKLNYPVPSDENLPKMFWVGLWCGSRGSGKSFACAKLLKKYEQEGIRNAKTGKRLEQRVIIISPTFDANPVWLSLNNLHPSDIHYHYSDETLDEILEDIETERLETLEYQRKMRLIEKLSSIKSVRSLTPDEIIELEMMDYREPEPPRFPNGVVNFLILDDCIGTSAFKSTGRSVLTNLALRNRHQSVNLALLSQSMKQIPKVLRTNASLFNIWRFANKKIVLDDLYEEVSNTLTPTKFEEIYDFATSADEHDFLVMDFSQPKEKRYKKNFTEIIHI
jgi:hypothetical protein